MLPLVVAICVIGLLIIYGVFLLVTGRGEFGRFVLALALWSVAIVAGSDAMAMLMPERFLGWKQVGLVAEAFLPPLWLLASLTFYRRAGIRNVSWLLKLLLALSPAFLLAVMLWPARFFFYSPDFAVEHVLFLGPVAAIFYSGLTVYMTVALMQLERTFVALPRWDRWRSKFELLGIGAVIAVLLLYYSQAFLYRTLNMNLILAREPAIGVAVLLMVYSRLRRGAADRIAVSRDMAFRSVVVLAVGLYLVGVGLLGEGLRYLGESFQGVLFALIAFLCVLAGVAALLSETLRHRVKVFLLKHFYAQKYDYRSQWLNFTQRLAAVRGEDDLYQALLAFFSEAFAARGAALFWRDGRALRPVARYDMAPVETVLVDENELVRYLEETERVFNVAETGPTVKKIHEDNEDFFRERGISFVVPLFFEGKLEGCLALGDLIHPGDELTYEDYDLMKLLAHQGAAAIAGLQLSAQLAKERELAAVGQVSTFVMHDLKNLVSSLSLLVDNAAHYLNDPEFQKDLLATLGGTVGKMKELMARLRNLEEKEALKLEQADLRALAVVGVQAAAASAVEVLGASVVTRVDPEEIKKVVVNLVLNAVEASSGQEPVKVEVGSNSEAFIRVTDCGCGITEEFIRQRLFRPFETTKARGFGIGLYHCKKIVEAHGGRIEVKSSQGAGTEFTVWLPLDGATLNGDAAA